MMHMPHHLSTAYFNHDRIFNLVKKGAIASILMGNTMKKMILWWKK